jgi:Bacterial protein of unknown function (Gcw_chp)
MKHRTIKLTAVAVIGFLALTFTSINLWADEEAKPSASADVGVFSQYIWRGYELSKDSVVIQPSMTVGYKDVSLNLWGNLDTDVYSDPSGQSQFNETDMTLSYGKSFGMVNVGVGYIYYGLDGVDDSQEIYLSCGLDTLLSPTLTVYREIAHLPSWYISLGISHSIELMKKITLDLAGSVGYYYSDDSDFVEVDDNLNPTTEKYRDFHNGLVSVGLTIPVAEYFTIKPMIAYSFPLTNEADNLITSTSFSNKSDFVYGGVTASISF